MNILLIRFSAMGDVAMTLPVLYSAARQHPEHRFTLLTRERFTRMALQAPSNLHFKGVDLQQYEGVSGLHRLFRLLQADHYDAVADLHDVLRTKVLRGFFLLHRTPVAVIRKGREEKKRLCAVNPATCTHTYPEAFRQLPSGFARYQDVLHRLGVDVQLDFQSMLPPVAEKKGIGIAPFAQHEGKIYPHMEAVIKGLSQRGEPIYLFGGGAQETETLSQWAERYPNTICLAGKLTLEEELEQMSQLRVMLSMDSANMHMASLVGTRVVSVWGATHPYAGFLGYQQSEVDCQQIELPCRPCSVFGNKACLRGDYACLNIPPDTIIDSLN